MSSTEVNNSERCVNCGHDYPRDSHGICLFPIREFQWCYCKCEFPATTESLPEQEQGFFEARIHNQADSIVYKVFGAQDIHRKPPSKIAQQCAELQDLITAALLAAHNATRADSEAKLSEGYVRGLEDAAKVAQQHLYSTTNTEHWLLVKKESERIAKEILALVSKYKSDGSGKAESAPSFSQTAIPESIQLTLAEIQQKQSGRRAETQLDAEYIADIDTLLSIIDSLQRSSAKSDTRVRELEAWVNRIVIFYRDASGLPLNLQAYCMRSEAHAALGNVRLTSWAVELADILSQTTPEFAASCLASLGRIAKPSS